MTDPPGVLAQAERDLRETRRVSPATCERFGELPAGWRSAFDAAAGLLGCPTVATAAGRDSGDGGEPVEPGLPGALARLLLLRISADTADPRWSSRVLEDLVDAALRVPGSTVGDLLVALVDLWAEHDTELTQPVATLIKDLTVLCVRRHRRAYQASDFGWLVRRLAPGAPAPTAYLALLALPDAALAAAGPSILAGLAGTPQAAEAARMLADDPA